MAKNPIAQRAAETKWLVEELRRHTESDEVVTYERLSQVAGLDVQREGRGRLASAIRIIRNEDHVRFGCVRTKGVVRLKVDGVMAHVNDRMDRIRRSAHEAGRDLECITADELDENKMRSFVALQSYAGFIEAITKHKRRQQLEAKIAAADEKHELSYGDMLQALLPGKRNGT